MYTQPGAPSTVGAADAAKILFNCATLLEMAGANPYRVAAYRRAARIFLQLGDLAPRVVANDEALHALGFGARLTRKLRELFATGELAFFVELAAELPAPVAGLLRVPGVGPKTALRLYAELGITSPQALAAAAQAGSIHTLHGFGPRREARWASLAVPAEEDPVGPAPARPAAELRPLPTRSGAGDLPQAA